MNIETQKKLELFANNNNWTSSHPLDMERFWQFVIEAYNNGEKELNSEDLRNVIEKIYEIDDNKLDKFIIKYEDGIELLRIYNENR